MIILSVLILFQLSVAFRPGFTKFIVNPRIELLKPLKLFNTDAQKNEVSDLIDSVSTGISTTTIPTNTISDSVNRETSATLMTEDNKKVATWNDPLTRETEKTGGFEIGNILNFALYGYIVYLIIGMNTIHFISFINLYISFLLDYFRYYKNCIYVTQTTNHLRLVMYEK